MRTPAALLEILQRLWSGFSLLRRAHSAGRVTSCGNLCEAAADGYDARVLARNLSRKSVEIRVASFVFGLALGCGRTERADEGVSGADAGLAGGGSDELTPEGEVLLSTEEDPRCGDARVDEEELGERCDDGNEESGDGCSADCLEVELGFVCRIPGGDCERVRVCGDGRQTDDEQCDDGNTDSDDGCNSSCLLETDYACPEPGEPCVSVVECGDSLVSGTETCDDGNDDDGDGCDSACSAELGWVCENAGAACRPQCGDGVVVGREICDDGNDADGDGCSSHCFLEFGWACDEPGEACTETTCGDGVVEGSEPCDDGDDIIVGDGCSPGCILEPTCDDGACTSVCGDGLMLAGDDEQCDDGNDVGGDGCSPTCQLEDGWACETVMPDPPQELELPVVYRDFIHKPAELSHPDFEAYSGDAATLGLVESRLGADGKPVYTGACESEEETTACPYGAQTTSKSDFDEWYRDADSNITVLGSLTFAPRDDGTFVFDSGGGLFPLEGQGWVAEGSEETSAEANLNYGFTTELRHWFEFTGDEFLEFSGDDDVWVFIGGNLVVDIGGLHPRTVGSVTLDEATASEFDLVTGHVYEIALFHAERHTYESNFRLTLKGFNGNRTECTTSCGDGITAGNEACDDGKDNGSGYGYCSEDCQLGPRCGDGVVEEDREVCDNGLNLDAYDTGEDACAPGCVRPPYCGDGQVDAGFGEECDDGDNDGEYGGCNEDCTLAPRCGDGEVNSEDEECDDGNRQNDDACDTECRDLRLGPAF